MLTLGEVRPLLAPHIRNGVAPESPVVAEVLFELCDRLLRRPDLVTFAHRQVVLYGWGTGLCVPRNVARVIRARRNNQIVPVVNKWMQFIEGGPGMAAEDTTGWFQLVDAGVSPTQYDLPQTAEGFQLLATSDQAEDVGAEVFIRGLDETGREIFYDGRLGETLPVTAGTGQVSHAKFSRVLDVKKPPTKGYIYLMAFDVETLVPYHLSAYHPDETSPSYRRYTVPGCRYSDGIPEAYALDAFVQLRALPLRRDEDLLPIDNLEALKFGVMALSLYEAQDFTKGDEAFNRALRALIEDGGQEPVAPFDFQVGAWSGHQGIHP